MSTVLAAISLLIFAFMCFKALYRPWWASVLVLSYIAYEQFLMSYFTVLARQSYIMNVTAGLVALLSVAVAFMYGHRPFHGYFNLNTIMVGLLYALAVFGVSYSMMPAAGMYFIRQGMPVAGLMLVILPLLVDSLDHIRKMSIPLMLVGCSLIILILISPRTQVYGDRLFIEFSQTKGGKDDRGNPLALAELGGLMILFATLMEPRRHVRLTNILRAASILLGISIAYLVGGRGQLVFAVAVAVMLYPVAHSVRDIQQFFSRAGAIGIFGIIMAMIAKIFLSSSSSSQRFTAEDITMGLQGRIYFATSMLNEYAANPANYLQGLGTGSFNAIVRHDGEGYLYPHNLIIEVLTHHGVIGFSLLMGIFTITGYHLYNLWRLAVKGVIDRSVVAILIAITSYLTLLSMKQGSFVLIPIPFYAYLIVSKLMLRTKHELVQDVLLDEFVVYDDWSETGEPGAV